MSRITFFLIAVSLLFCACSKEEVPELEKPLALPEEEVIRIPVVVHVVNYLPDPFEISDAKIRSQIEVLNQDFRKKNSDYVRTPEEFIERVADVGIEFYLAFTDPQGNPSSGIIRSASERTGWDGKTPSSDDAPIESYRLYFSDKGGQDAWPNTAYLNIWVADLSDRLGNLRLAAYAQFPGVDPRIDGIVIDPRVVGTLPPLIENYELGRTCTHEIGHWLNLLHIYGEDGNCGTGDQVDDTPSQLSQYSASPVHPQVSCGSHDMFMNFMDRVDDKAMYMFTLGQRARMRALFREGGARRALYLNNIK